MLFYPKITCIFMIYVYLSWKFVVAIYALFPPIFLAWKVDSANLFTFRMYASMYIVYLPPCICKYICANIYLQGVSKKRSFSRLAPLEAPRLFIGLEIIPKCYQILYIGQTHPFKPIFIAFMDGFPQIMDHLSGTKSIADMYCSVCCRILYSKIFNSIHEKGITHEVVSRAAS